MSDAAQTLDVEVVDNEAANRYEARVDGRLAGRPARGAQGPNLGHD